MKKKRLPGIGLRIIKSAIAVLLCFVVNALRGGAGIVFYSQLSALWCMQTYRNHTKKNAIQRFIGTCIGAGYGLIFLLSIQMLGNIQPMQNWEVELFISLLIVLVLYTTVLIKKKQASYFSCVVFLSIAVNHLGDANPYLFVLNRFIDTIVGIVIGVVVNDFVLPAKKQRDTLFISTLDDTLHNEDEPLSDYSKAELNRLIDDGLAFTVATMRTPAIICETLRDVHLKLPVIAMDGAVLYDTNTKSYIRSYVISADMAAQLQQFIARFSPYYFTNIVIEDTLLIYYQKEMQGKMRELVQELRVSPYRNYIARPVPPDEDVIYFMLLEETAKMQELYDAFLEAGYDRYLKIVFYPSTKYEGYSYIKIFNKNASMEHMMDYLMEYTGKKKKLTLGTIAGKYDVTVSGENVNEAVRMMKRIFERPFWEKAQGNVKK